jgi:protoporphyrinogen oxidase
MQQIRDIDVLILGGGPAGMAAAMELTKAGRRATVVEKSTQVGGLAKTLEFYEPEGTYRTDIGPHRFFSKNKYLYDFIEDLLGEEWRQVQRLTRFYIDGKFFFYPIRAGDVLRNIGLTKGWAFVRDLLWEKIRARITRRRLGSFEDYAVATFGRSLAEWNMLQYTEKIWGLPCDQISVDWALQRIGGLSVGAAIRKMFLRRSGPKTLVDSFYYPSRGSGTIYEAIADRIAARGGETLLESEPIAIRHTGMRVDEVDVQTPDGIVTFRPRAVVCSIPLPQSVALLDPTAPEEVHAAAGALRFRAQVYLFLTVARDSVTKDNWVYFPEKSIHFGRISEMKNFSLDMCPPGHTSLFIEFFCFEGDAIWLMEKDALAALAVGWLERLGFLRGEEVRSVRHFRQPNVYPIYDLQYKDRLRTIMAHMDAFENFFAVGRPGRFRYTNQDHSLEMGILAARSILTGQRLDIENVGQEAEYFERGVVPEAGRTESPTL